MNHGQLHFAANSTLAQLVIGFAVPTLWNRGANDLGPVAEISGSSTGLDQLPGDFRGQ
jgi:hypothetical protein